MNKITFDDDTIVVAGAGHLAAEVGDETVIMSVADGVYYGLNAVGARIWALIQRPQTVRAVQDALLAEYEVAPDVCARELRTLLQQLAAQGLIDVTADAAV